MPPYHVLIVDDDDAIRSLLARIVVRTYPAVTVWAVNDGRKALDVYDHHQLDLLITNYDMPRLDGLALLATLRQTRQTTLPILMVSANMTIEPQARALGVTDFVIKPFSIPHLTAILTTLLPPQRTFLLYDIVNTFKVNAPERVAFSFLPAEQIVEGIARIGAAMREI